MAAPNCAKRRTHIRTNLIGDDHNGCVGAGPRVPFSRAVKRQLRIFVLGTRKSRITTQEFITAQDLTICFGAGKNGRGNGPAAKQARHASDQVFEFYHLLHPDFFAGFRWTGNRNDFAWDLKGRTPADPNCTGPSPGGRRDHRTNCARRSGRFETGQLTAGQ
jgi:hypothetical protein